VLAAFMSTWSNARRTFGENTPQTGARYDNSVALRQLKAELATAAPAARWTGAAAASYGAANTEQGRVVGEIANLDRRLRAHIDQSARTVATGRADLDAVRKWVTAAAASVPQTAARERMLLPIVQKGLSDVASIVASSTGDLNAIGAKISALGDEYQKLSRQRFGIGGGPRFAGGDEPKHDWTPRDDYERALKDAGVLEAPPKGYYKEWIENAKRQHVPPVTLVDIAKRHNLTPQSFDVLNKMKKVTDKQGKSFFLLTPGTTGDDARNAALMTYILNCGTDYGEDAPHDFAPTPYSADEVQRIIDRQNANSWSYDHDVAFVQGNGGRLMATPNGMLMGCGGNWLQDIYSEGGGSTWGDIFMMNIDDPSDPGATLEKVAGSGHMWYPQPGGEGAEGSLDLDRILHHEERHSQQWQRYGYIGFLDAYATGKLVEIFTDHPLEKDAGLSDGGYR
jgi:hypothetical protein